MLLGFAVAPVAAVLISLACWEAFWHMGLLPNGFPVHSIDAAGALSVGVAVLAVIMTLTAAVPGVLWLQRRGSLTFGNVVLGAVAGKIQSPMAGVQGSALAVAVSNAGGFGSAPCAMLDLDGIRRELDAIRAGRLRGPMTDLAIGDAVAAGIPALARLRVTTWNATHRGGRSGGPSCELREGSGATRSAAWTAAGAAW